MSNSGHWCSQNGLERSFTNPTFAPAGMRVSGPYQQQVDYRDDTRSPAPAGVILRTTYYEIRTGRCGENWKRLKPLVSVTITPTILDDWPATMASAVEKNSYPASIDLNIFSFNASIANFWLLSEEFADNLLYPFVCPHFCWIFAECKNFLLTICWMRNFSADNLLIRIFGDIFADNLLNPIS